MTLDNAEIYALIMARIARVVVPEMPRHITQRDNRRQQSFFDDDDYLQYLLLLTGKIFFLRQCLISIGSFSKARTNGKAVGLQ